MNGNIGLIPSDDRVVPTTPQVSDPIDGLVAKNLMSDPIDVGGPFAGRSIRHADVRAALAAFDASR